jgi:hypothetical protein
VPLQGVHPNSGRVWGRSTDGMEVAQELVDVDGHDAPEVKANENMPDSEMKGFASRIN